MAKKRMTQAARLTAFINLLRKTNDGNWYVMSRGALRHSSGDPNRPHCPLSYVAGEVLKKADTYPCTVSGPGKDLGLHQATSFLIADAADLELERTGFFPEAVIANTAKNRRTRAVRRRLLRALKLTEVTVDGEN